MAVGLVVASCVGWLVPFLILHASSWYCRCGAVRFDNFVCWISDQAVAQRKKAADRTCPNHVKWPKKTRPRRWSIIQPRQVLLVFAAWGRGRLRKCLCWMTTRGGAFPLFCAMCIIAVSAPYSGARPIECTGDAGTDLYSTTTT